MKYQGHSTGEPNTCADYIREKARMPDMHCPEANSTDGLNFWSESCLLRQEEDMPCHNKRCEEGARLAGRTLPPLKVKPKKKIKVAIETFPCVHCGNPAIPRKDLKLYRVKEDVCPEHLATIRKEREALRRQKAKKRELERRKKAREQQSST